MFIYQSYVIRSLKGSASLVYTYLYNLFNGSWFLTVFMLNMYMRLVGFHRCPTNWYLHCI
jgi:hypothetical protein